MRVNSTVICCISVTLFLACIFIAKEATTQDSKSEQSPVDQHNAQQLQMMKFYGQAIESMAEAMLSEKTAKIYAKFSKDFYDALIAEGFSTNDALKIVVSTNIPLPAPSGQ